MLKDKGDMTTNKNRANNFNIPLLNKFVYDYNFFLKALTLAGQTIQASPTSAPTFVVVFVEGQQYVTNGAALLREAVRPLQALGVTVYLVAIGNKINRQELTSMVQNSEHIVRVPDFTQLLQGVGEISNLIGETFVLLSVM